MGWDAMGWYGMGWDGMRWDEMGWDGMGWDRISIQWHGGDRDTTLEQRHHTNSPPPPTPLLIDSLAQLPKLSDRRRKAADPDEIHAVALRSLDVLDELSQRHARELAEAIRNETT